MCEVVVIIGCSLVDTDFHLSGMLSHAIKKRKDKRQPFIQVVAVDKSKIRRRWFRLLKGCVKTERGYKRFDNFAQKHLK